MMGAVDDPTYVNPLISLFLIAWWLGVICVVVWFLHCCIHNRPFFPPPRQRPPRPPRAP